MSDDRERPEQDSGSSFAADESIAASNGEATDEARSRDGAEARSRDGARSEEERAAADTAQRISETDQERSASDRSSTERDLAQADADESALQRDRSAIDRERSSAATAEEKSLEAFAAIHADRERIKVEREAAADDRASAAEDRDRAALDRRVAAEDRDRAAEDRARAKLGLEQAMLELQQAQLDDLTGFYSLRLGTAVLQEEIDRSRRSDGRLVIAYCDLDTLKQVNDEQGHAAGDALLKGLAAVIRSQLRSYDPVVRVGGDEFVCALSEIDLEQAEKTFRAVQTRLAERHEGASVSFGLAALHPDDDLTTLLERSDRALHAAKSELRAAKPGAHPE